jgi:hypothetical protein
MQYFARIENGIVVEIVTIPAGAAIGNYFHADFAAALVSCAATVAAGMQYANGGFTPAPPPAAPALAQLAAALVTAASAACGQVTNQITPDAAHQYAFTNAAAILNGNGGAAPASGPLAAKFDALAAAYGQTPANFALLVTDIQGASLDLGAALVTLESAAATATTAAQLAAALTAFETSIGAVIAEITAADVSAVAPAAITILGINA